MKKSLVLIALVLNTLVARVNGQNSYSLSEATTYAAEHSPLVKNSKTDIEIYKQKVKEIRAIGLPQVNVEGSFNNFLNIPTSVIPATIFNPAASADQFIPVKFGVKYQTSAGATLSQLLFDGSYIIALKAMQSLEELQVQIEQKTEIDVKNEVVKAYYMAIVADENIKTLQFTQKNLEELFRETKAINNEKLNESQDVEQFELTVESMKNNIERAKVMRSTAYNLLKLNMGIDVMSEIILKDNIDTLNAAFKPSDYTNREFTAGGLTDYKLLQLQVKLNELNLRNEKMKYYPSFGAFLTHSYNLPSNKLDFFDNRRWFPTTIFGLKLSVPVFSGGMRNAKVQQAKLTLEKSVTTLQSAENGLKMQAETAKLNFNYALQNVTTTKRLLELAERVEEKTLVKFKEGISSSLELTQAQMQYLNAQSSYVNALYGLLSAKAEMDKAFGLIQANTTNK